MPEYLWLVVVGSFAAFAFGWGTGGIAPPNTQVGVGLGLRPFDAFGDSLPVCVCGSLLAREYICKGRKSFPAGAGTTYA